jgi:hypothetical protein
VLDTTYLLAASIVRAKGSIQSGIHSDRTPVSVGGRHASSIIPYVTLPTRSPSTPAMPAAW